MKISFTSIVFLFITPGIPNYFSAVFDIFILWTRPNVLLCEWLNTRKLNQWSYPEHHKPWHPPCIVGWMSWFRSAIAHILYFIYPLCAFSTLMHNEMHIIMQIWYECCCFYYAETVYGLKFTGSSLFVQKQMWDRMRVVRSRGGSVYETV